MRKDKIIKEMFKNSVHCNYCDDVNVCEEKEYGCPNSSSLTKFDTKQYLKDKKKGRIKHNVDKYEIDLDKIKTLSDMKSLMRIILLFVAKSNTEPTIEITSDSVFYDKLRHLERDK